MFNYQEILDHFDSVDYNELRLYFLMSNRENGYIYKASLTDSAKRNLLENVGAFFDTSNIKFENQEIYDFKGKADDNTVEHLDITTLPIISDIIASTTEATSDLKMMNFTKIKSFLIEIMLQVNSEKKSLYLFSASKSNSFLDIKKSGLFELDDNSIDIAKIPEKLITIPEYFDICVYDDIILFLTHSTSLLNKIVSLDKFYDKAINSSLDLIESMDLIEDFERFKSIALEKKDNAIIKSKFASMYASKSIQFENLSSLYESNVTKFKKNFEQMRVEVGFKLEFNNNNKIELDVSDGSQVISLLNLLIDAYAKTFMLEKVIGS